ncbi:QRI7 [Sanghuangporus weigelae]
MLSAARRSLRRRQDGFGSLNRKSSLGWSGGGLTRWTKRDFTVLALESSADDTCAAVVTSEREILSNIVLNQSAKIEEYGGIAPYVAIHEHQRKMPIAVRRALDEAKLDMSQIDGIAFTRGPGMAGCLSVCANAAKTLASALRKPLVGAHHMQAHALTSILTSTSLSERPTFPFLTLLISGGHTLLLIALSLGKFKILATTADEAVGHAIDRVSRGLRIEWRGRAPGAALEAFCRDGVEGVKEEDVPRVEQLKIPFRNELRFSFSGLHSIVNKYIAEHGTVVAPSAASSLEEEEKGRLSWSLSDPHRLAIARAFQTAAVEQLEEKIVLALRWCADNRESILRTAEASDSSYGPKLLLNKRIPVKHVVVSGGVASNMFFRERLQACLAENFPDEELSLVFPPPSLCTDNAAMIAWASMHRFLAGDTDDYSIESKPKWSIEELDMP